MDLPEGYSQIGSCDNCGLTGLIVSKPVLPAEAVLGADQSPWECAVDVLVLCATCDKTPANTRKSEPAAATLTSPDFG
jgi:hypothetical protein